VDKGGPTLVITIQYKVGGNIYTILRNTGIILDADKGYGIEANAEKIKYLKLYFRLSER
jgi:hypothetical protein